MTVRNLCIAVFLSIALAASAVAQRGSSGSGRETVSGGRTAATGNMRLPNSTDDTNAGTTKKRDTQLQFNDKLATKLKTMLPEGVDPHKASKGFEDLKDFVAAVRVANNLNVSFVDLKRNMADGSNKELQKAIHALKPDADPKAELKKAGEQAKQDIKESKQS